jgi:hypothetical protein
MPPEPDFDLRSSALPLQQFRCVGCGYGASSRSAPARCPMCGGVSWARESRQRYVDVTADLVAAARRAGILAGGAANAPLLREAEEVSVFPGVPLS